jgi:hypothetical protein
LSLIDRVRLVVGAAAASATASPVRTDIASPFSANDLNKVVWSDVFGTQPTIITREEALAIPAVHKARALVISLIADKPLIAFRDPETRLPSQPTWTRRTNGAVSPWHRMAMTLDDLIFYGWSLWATKRGASGQVLDAERVPVGLWRFGERGVVEVIDPDSGSYRVADEREVVLIPGPSEGLIQYAARSFGGAIAIEDSWVKRAQSPIPLVELHQTQESDITPAEAEKYVKDWDAARIKGATAFTPHDIEAKALGTVSADLYIEGRNASRLDVANFFNLPASLLDGSVSEASLTYSTQQGDANEVALYALPYWIRPIEGRLSQDDVVPAGQFVRFDISGFVSLPQSPIGEPGNE